MENLQCFGKNSAYLCISHKFYKLVKFIMNIIMIFVIIDYRQRLLLVGLLGACALNIIQIGNQEGSMAG